MAGGGSVPKKPTPKKTRVAAGGGNVPKKRKIKRDKRSGRFS